MDEDRYSSLQGRERPGERDDAGSEAAGGRLTPTMTRIEVKPVANARDREVFLRVPFAVFGDDPKWIAPLLFERREHIDAKKNPYFAHAEVQLFIALREGEPVGRISAQVDRLRLERHRDGTGQFGFLDAIDDRAVFTQLMRSAEDWLKS